MDSAHQPADEKRPPPSTTETHLPLKKQKMVMGRQQRGAPNDRAGDGGKGQGLDGPHYRVTDQDWKMCKSSLGAFLCLPLTAPSAADGGETQAHSRADTSSRFPRSPPLATRPRNQAAARHGQRDRPRLLGVPAELQGQGEGGGREEGYEGLRRGGMSGDGTLGFHSRRGSRFRLAVELTRRP